MLVGLVVLRRSRTTSELARPAVQGWLDRLHLRAAEGRFPAGLRWPLVVGLLVLLVRDLVLVERSGGSRSDPTIMGDYLTAILAAVFGWLVALRPRWAPVAFLPFITLMASDPYAYLQMQYLYFSFAFAMYVVPLASALGMIVALFVWQVTWLSTVSVYGLSALWIHLVIGVMAILPGLALRHFEWRAHWAERDAAVAAAALGEAAVHERRELARELHDVVAHQLTIIAMHARVGERSREQQVQRDSLHLIGNESRQAMVELRRLLNLLRQEQSVSGADADPGEGAGADDSIQNAVADTATALKMVGMKAHCEVTGDLAAIPQGLHVTVRALLREGATNAIKHGRSPVLVRLTVDQIAVTVEVRNAIARERSFPRSGLGMTGLRERVTSLRGQFSTGPVGHEWVLRAVLPTGS